MKLIPPMAKLTAKGFKEKIRSLVSKVILVNFTGTYDSALKLGQLKVDLFNDTRADIKYILQGENRMNSFVGYESPELIEGMKVA